MNRRDLMVKFDSEGRSLPALLAEAKRAVAGKVFVRPETLSHRMDRHFEDEQRAEARFGLILGLMIVLLYAGTGTNPGETYSLKPDEMNLLSWTPRASRKPCHTMATHSLQLSGNH
jgi:hypothetical protein